MHAISAQDAKTRLLELLDRVGRGECFLITKHGRAIAQLAPAPGKPPVNAKEVIQQMEQWQMLEGPTLGPDVTVLELREEGRQF